MVGQLSRPRPRWSAAVKAKTCCIQWIDKHGKPTPDTNLAIGTVYRKTYVSHACGRSVVMPQTEKFPICTQHARRLDEPDMAYWVFEPFETTEGTP